MTLFSKYTYKFYMDIIYMSAVTNMARRETSKLSMNI